MTTANQTQALDPKPVAAGRTPKHQDPSQGKAVETAEAILLTLESLALAARALLATASPKDGRERRQLERARLSLDALPARARQIAGQLDAPGGPEYAKLATVQATRDAIDEFASDANDAIEVLRAIDSHGELQGVGAAAIHSDIVLTVLVEQLERADAELNLAIPAHVASEPVGHA